MVSFYAGLMAWPPEQISSQIRDLQRAATSIDRVGELRATATRLIARLYDPAVGAVRLASADLPTLRLAELRRHVGVVTQDVQRFRAIVRDSLTFSTSPSTAIEELGLSGAFRAPRPRAPPGAPRGRRSELPPPRLGLKA